MKDVTMEDIKSCSDALDAIDIPTKDRRIINQEGETLYINDNGETVTMEEKE